MYFANVFTHLDELTNGVSAELIIANDGVTLHGIRVSWTIKSKYSNCIYVSPRVDLNSGEVGKDITFSDNSAEFLNLDCNRQYTPRVGATVSHTYISDNGNQLFYGGNKHAMFYLHYTCMCVENSLGSLFSLNFCKLCGVDI